MLDSTTSLSHHVNSCNGPPSSDQMDIPDSLVRKVLGFMENSRAFKGYTYQNVLDLIVDLETWEVPKVVEEAFPYYQAGYDQHDRPVWALELGDCDLAKVVSQGDEIIPTLEKAMFLATYRIIRSMHERDTPEKEIRQATFLTDFQGFKMSQMADPRCLAFLLRMARTYCDIASELCGLSILVNMNLIVQTVSKMFRPIFRTIMDRVKMHGTNEAKWVPCVRQLLPLDVIPPSFGGKENFVPLCQFGYPEKFRKKSVVIDGSEATAVVQSS